MPNLTITHGFYSILTQHTLKQHTVSPEEIQHRHPWRSCVRCVKSKSEVSTKRLLRGRKHFSQSVMIYVAVSKLGKTHLVFMQPGAKINSVYYCDNVLEQGLLSGIRRLSNKLWHSVSTVRSAGTPFTSDCRLPALPCAWVHWTRKLATKQSVFKSCDLLCVGTLPQMVYRHKNSDIDQLKAWNAC